MVATLQIIQMSRHHIPQDAIDSINRARDIRHSIHEIRRLADQHIKAEWNNPITPLISELETVEERHQMNALRIILTSLKE